MTTRTGVAIVLALVTMWVVPAAAQAPPLIDLGTLESQAVAINASGQVAGWSTLANGDSHVFLWDPVNGMQNLFLGVSPLGLEVKLSALHYGRRLWSE